MYEVRVEARFCAAHQLRLASGGLEPLHGHDWVVQAVFRGAMLDQSGMLVDFVLVREKFSSIIAVLHHRILNEIPLIDGLGPSAEVIARYLFEQLDRAMGRPSQLAAVYVQEAPGCMAGYGPSL